MFKFLAGAALAASLPLASARAQDAPAAASSEPAFTLSPSMEIASDYRFRGISLSDFKPVVQPSLTLAHRSGAYANLFFTTLADNGGAGTEFDTTIGYAFEAGGLSVDVAAARYFYPGARALDYHELLAEVRRPIGIVDAGLTLAYAPPQGSLGDRSNRYVAFDASLPFETAPGALVAGFGIEDGAFGDRKRDWTVGVEYTAGPAAFALRYVDSARSGLGALGRAGVVVSVSVPAE